MGKNQPRTDTGEFGEHDKSAWLKAVESIGKGGTNDVHEKVCELWEGTDEPAYKTTYNKLHELADEGEVARDEVGGNWQWIAKGDSQKDHVYKIVADKGPARAETLAEFSELPEEEFKELLRDLEDDGRIASELAGDVLLWQLP